MGCGIKRYKLLCTKQISNKDILYSTGNYSHYYYFFLSFVLLGPHPGHMEVPRLGVESEPTPQPQQLGTRAVSWTYTTVHGSARSLATE